MKIAVFGGTVLVGSQVVQKLTLASHDAVLRHDTPEST